MATYPVCMKMYVLIVVSTHWNRDRSDDNHLSNCIALL